MHMNDQYGTAGDEMTDTWTIFGDPSLMVRTNTPVPLVVSHATTIDVSATACQVSCATSGALVCLSHQNEIVAAGFNIAGNTSLNITGIHIGDTLDLTVTAYNSIPYISQIVVTSATAISKVNSKPYLIYPNPASGSLNKYLA